jgi:alanine racemase
LSEAWIDINLDATINNYQEVIKYLSPGAKVMAVVKADAYGLGAVEVAKTLVEQGCEAFAVTTVDEGLILRKHGIHSLILVLGPITSERMEEAIEADLQLTLSDLQMLKSCEAAAARLGKEAQIHLKLETGMGRTGFFEKDLECLAEELKCSSNVIPVGIYTHLARASQRDKAYTQEQYASYQRGVQKLEKLGIRGMMKHICNSAAFLEYPEWHLDFVRIGTLLIGHFPSPSFAEKLKLLDPWVAKTRIVHLRQAPKGTFVGYQSIYRTKSQTQLAVIPVGYADGFGVAPHFVPQGFWDFIKIIIKNFLALLGVYLGQETVSLKGQTIRVAGKIGMQLTVLDVGKISCQVGDEVIFPLRRTLANPRMVRQYWREKRLIAYRLLEEGISPIHPEYSNDVLE